MLQAGKVEQKCFLNIIKHIISITTEKYVQSMYPILLSKIIDLCDAMFTCASNTDHSSVDLCIIHAPKVMLQIPWHYSLWDVTTQKLLSQPFLLPLAFSRFVLWRSIAVYIHLYPDILLVLQWCTAASYNKNTGTVLF